MTAPGQADATRRWYERPLVCFGAAAAMFGIAAALLAPGALLPFPSATHAGALASQGVFFVAAAALVACSRRWPRLTDPLDIALGVAWITVACGPHFSIYLLVLSLFVYHGLRGLQPLVAFFVTVAVALLLVYVMIPESALALEGWRHPWPVLCLGECVMRVAQYAFEASAIPARRRSAVAFLSYGAFSFSLWSGPTWLSYLTSRTPEPQRDLDRLGCRQLLRAGAKVICFVGLLRLVVAFLPDRAAFPDLSPGAQVALLAAPYVSFFLFLSLNADFGCAVSNLTGRHAPDAFRWPLLAAGPFDYWRRWNIHMLDFLRRAFIYPTALRFRGSLFAVIAFGMGGSWIVHSALSVVKQGPKMDLVAALIRNGMAALPFVILLILALPIERRAQRRRRPFLALILPWQIIASVLMFPTMDNIYTWQGHRRVPSSTYWCFASSIVDRGRSCTADQGAPP
jgi:hypothetical protein